MALISAYMKMQIPLDDFPAVVVEGFDGASGKLEGVIIVLLHRVGFIDQLLRTRNLDWCEEVCHLTFK
jgi:hypothetical protein